MCGAMLHYNYVAQDKRQMPDTKSPANEILIPKMPRSRGTTPTSIPQSSVIRKGSNFVQGPEVTGTTMSQVGREIGKVGDAISKEVMPHVVELKDTFQREILPKIGSSIDTISSSVSENILPSIGRAIDEVSGSVSVNVVPRVGTAIENISGTLSREVGVVIENIGNEIPKVGDAMGKLGDGIQTNIVNRIGGSLEDINGITHDIRANTVPQVNDTLLSIQQAVDNTQTTTVIFLVVFTITCIAVIILIIYYIYRDMNRGTVYQSY